MLSYTNTGTGSAVVFLHGLGLNRNFWGHVIPHLSHRHRCIAVDLPGHGDSRDVKISGSMSAYAASVREVIEKLELKDVTLVGHSMGAQIAIILALQIPSSVISKLILVSAAGIETFTADEAVKMKAATNAMYRNPIGEELLNRTFMHSRKEIMSLLMHEHIVQQQSNFQRFSETICSSVAGMLNEPVIQFLDKITQPTMCVYGQLDTAIPNRWLHPQLTIQQIALTAKEKIKDSKVEIFPLAGHYLPVDAAEELAERIQNFIK